MFNNIYILFTIILFIIIFILYYLYNKNNKYNLTNDLISTSVFQANLGNEISYYYYFLVESILLEKDFIYHKSYAGQTFLKDLPTFIKFNKFYYVKLINQNVNLNDFYKIQAYAFWSILDGKDEIIHTIMKPLMNSIFNSAFKKSGIKGKISVPIIHFRCSDIPFVRHPQYFLQKLSFFDDALTKFNLDDKNIIILHNSSHLSNPDNQEMCSFYVNNIKQYLEDLEYNIEITTDNLIQDFANMFYAPFVISTGGSFSFMSGFFGYGKFISTTHGLYGERGSIKDCDKCSDIILKNYNIDHADIQDYYNKKEMIAHLES
jgi:hypothetical protein